ncbi:Ppx/GppA phosphatase family protein [Aquisalimonas asiatica]|uniref:Exopolyphosphatase / guanosine-5'-triphosphate,3'-diphosphate pyrophosphatase n=1 Tax=Aquisalimonas asiatica TaxID=406100 RepID=A0A1H8QA70_9GAMM|nr:Ppx/GppA phosphatase family protein [Aquisalimonas asiatica]SEO50956.1 exopolyphosphatase / guanosine-5'-triphosphate,3'-diphosphate pyrophosphatase [Aquisalimonas asiatica]
MTASASESGNTVAAVDLGSNSFHMVVARLQGGELRVVDRIKTMVRLGEGVDARGRLDPAVRERALEALDRFGQRLRGLPRGSVRVVGTNTLRVMRDAQGFQAAAESALGHGVEVVSGVEEARLIYLGVAHSLGDDGQRRLVVDIGGGSTELIVGEGVMPLHMDSLEMGCVRLARQCFPKGRYTPRALDRAALRVAQELEPVARRYHNAHWAQAVGASGTVRAVQAVLKGLDLSPDAITLDGLLRLRECLTRAGRESSLDLPGLDADRRPVFAGGVMVLLGVFQGLGIQRMVASDGALREGVLHDLLGRMASRDVRDQAITAMMARYHVDAEQANRVSGTARHLFGQVRRAWGLDDEAEAWLRWAAETHEIGLDIAHGSYHRHGEYLARHSDLSGFSSQDQAVLAALIRCHRRKISRKALDAVPDNRRLRVERLIPLLRLATVLHRSRLDDALPAVALRRRDDRLDLRFPAGWLEAHPLTRADLAEESTALKRLGLALRVR